MQNRKVNAREIYRCIIMDRISEERENTCGCPSRAMVRKAYRVPGVEGYWDPEFKDWGGRGDFPGGRNRTSNVLVAQRMWGACKEHGVNWMVLNSMLKVAQMVKNLPAMQETRVRFLGLEDPLENGMAAHSSILAWRVPWTEEPGGLQSTGGKESDMTKRLTRIPSWGAMG